MKRSFVVFGFICAVPAIGSAGGLPELVFESGFEGVEACVIFDGVGDQVSIPVITVSGDFELNGGAFPANEFDDAVISLLDRDTGNVFPLGNTHDQSYSVHVIPGRYDVIYDMESAGGSVPRNRGAVLMEDVELAESGTLDIAVTAYLLGGDLLLDGVPFPANEFDDALIHLDGEMAGTLLLGETNQQAYAGVPVLPGDYEVRYQAETHGNTVPWNAWGYVGLVTVNGDDPNLDIDVPVMELTGSFKHNGVLMPTVEYDDGHFYLETSAGDRALLDNSHAQNYARNVIPGSYDLFWEVETRGDTVPFNTRGRIGANIDISGGTLAVNMTSHALSGAFLLNGGAFPASVQHSARMLLRDTVAGSDSELGFTHDGSYDHQVLDGSYEVVYQHLQGDQVPENTAAIVDSFVLKNDAVRDIDVAAALFSAPVYHNGVLFPADQSQIANILLRDPASDDVVGVGRVAQQTVTALAVAGTYDIYYGYLSGDSIPVNEMARLYSGYEVEPGVFALPQGGGFQIDVDSMLIGGGFFLNDVAPPASEFDDGDVSLRIDIDSIALGSTADQTYLVRMIERDEDDIFHLFYEAESVGAEVPANRESAFACMVLVPQPF